MKAASSIRHLPFACGISLLVCVGVVAQGIPHKTHNDRFPAPPEFTAEEWQLRAAYLRDHILASAGLLPLPEKTPLGPVIFGTITHNDHTVAKVYFESLPGFYVTGNLYRPIGEGPFPAILSPHGHWAFGRLENTPTASGPGRAINLARQGFVVFSYDMVGYNDSRQLPHTFGGRRESLWGLSLAGLQLWNSIRALDFLETLPYVRRDAIGATGESGGGTQTFLLAAVDSRVAVAAPVNMISLHMQGGCLCENAPGLRLDTTNVEIAATVAPRPLLMVSATGDWTKETLEVEYPAVRKIYELVGAADRVYAVRIDAEHNYNRASREAMYAWMARWLQKAAPDAHPTDRSFTPDPLPDLLVFHGRTLPPGAVTAAQLTEDWVRRAAQQLAAMPSAFGPALRHALGFAWPPDLPSIDERRGAAGAARAATKRGGRRPVLLATTETSLAAALTRAGFEVESIAFTPFDAESASKIRHFETYNRTAASQRVADIVAAIRRHPGAPLIADGDAALAGLLAAAIVEVPRAILDVGRFDRSSDAAFLEHLDIPGLRRAGDLQTAATLARGKAIVHNAGERFGVSGLDVRPQPLTASEIVALLRQVK